MMLNFFKSKVFNIFFISYSLIILSISFMLYEHTNVVVVSLKKGNIEIPNVNKFNPQKDKNTIVNVNEYFKFLYEKIRLNIIEIPVETIINKSRT